MGKKKEEKQYDLRNLEDFFKFVYYHQHVEDI